MKGLLCVLAVSVAAGALLLNHDPNSPDSPRLDKLGHPDTIRSLVVEHSPPMMTRWSAGLRDRLPAARP